MTITKARPAAGLTVQVEAWLAEIAGDVAPRTQNQYREALARLIPWMEEEGLTWLDLDQGALNRWRAHLLTTPSPVTGRVRTTETVNSYARGVNVFLRWAVERKLVPPGDHILRAKVRRRNKREKEPEAISESDYRALLHAATNDRDRAVLRLFWESGIRVGEAAALTHKSLVMGTKPRLRIEEREDARERSGSGAKTGYRLLSLRPDLASELDRLGKANKGPLFVGERAARKTGRREPLTESGLYQLVADLGARAGLKTKVSPQRFRVAFAKRFSRKLPINELAAVMGNSPAVLWGFYQGQQTEEAMDIVLQTLDESEEESRSSGTTYLP